MQKAQDMSLPERVSILERRLLKSENKRAAQWVLVEEIAEYLEVVMTFLDGSYNGRKQFHQRGC